MEDGLLEYNIIKNVKRNEMKDRNIKSETPGIGHLMPGSLGLSVPLVSLGRAEKN